ncbi:MAG: hypothetical protein ACRD0N_00265 [Acidimicrobiales bacterium]
MSGGPQRDRTAARLGWAALGCATLVVSAIVLEVVGGTAANSPAPGRARYVVPLAWPAAWRVVWWLAVAAAALGLRVALHRLGFRQRRLIVTASVAPFVVFAAGIAAGADWATWH